MIRLRLLVVGFVLLCVAPAALADDLKPAPREAELTVIVTAPYIDLRTGPGRGYPIFHVAEKHEILQLLKRRTDWYKVATTDGKTGWIKGSDLHLTHDEEGVPLDFSVPGWQAYQARRWELIVTGGDFAGARSLSLALGYQMSEHLAAEVRYGQAFGDFSDSKLASLNIVHQPFPQWRLAPFFTLGTGTVKTSPATALVLSEDRRDKMLSVGGGFKLLLSQHFALRLEYNQHTLLTTRENNEEVDEWKAGFSVSF
jgi:hypothetical protein